MIVFVAIIWLTTSPLQGIVWSQAGAAPTPQVEPGTWGGERYIIDADVLNDLIPKALEGDRDAAVKVWTHFYVTEGSSGEGLAYWRLIAAENGDPHAQAELAWFMYRSDQDFRSKIRAKFWATKAITSGDPTAADNARRLLEDIEKDERVVGGQQKE